MPMTAPGDCAAERHAERKEPAQTTRGQTDDVLITIESGFDTHRGKTIARPTARTLDAREKKRAVLNEKRSL